MKIIETKEVVENDVTYIVNTYDNGTIEQYAKTDPNYKPPEPEPTPAPVTLEQLDKQQKEIKANQLDMMEAIGELYMMQDGGATV